MLSMQNHAFLVEIAYSFFTLKLSAVKMCMCHYGDCNIDPVTLSSAVALLLSRNYKAKNNVCKQQDVAINSPAMN